MKALIVPYIDDRPDVPPLTKEQISVLHIFVDKFLGKYHYVKELLQQREDEIALLKGEKVRPTFKPSRMLEEAGIIDASVQSRSPEAIDDGNGNGGATVSETRISSKRPGSAKRSKTAQLKITRDVVIEPSEAILTGSRFKGYDNFVTQDIRIELHNIRYRLARWQTPDGRHLLGKLPAALAGTHFGGTLVSHILYQHHQCQVTQPLLHEQLTEWGVQISAGQINAILCHNKTAFHQEKDAILVTGLASSSYISTDDTGNRHQGNNGYTTHIGNEAFAWFKSTLTKSRINFLEILHAGEIAYQINLSALAYMHKQGLPQLFRDILSRHHVRRFADETCWHAHLDAIGMRSPHHRKTATQAALLGSLQHNGMAQNLAIISDDAQQFNVLIHGLCWVHAERLVHKSFAANAMQRAAIAHVRSDIWTLYAALKAYKLAPDAMQKSVLSRQFDEVFTQTTGYASLDLLLERLYKNKAELLLVLERPDVPLHTNGSECDIRDFVKKKKVSGGTRSELGRQCRDTFASLKKTCRKLGISFWAYLTDRISCSDQIPPLHQLVEQRLAKIQSAAVVLACDY